MLIEYLKSGHYAAYYQGQVIFVGLTRALTIEGAILQLAIDNS